MKRKLIIILVMILLLTGFGRLLYNPPTFMDVITQATPKKKKAEQEAAVLQGNYILGIHTSIPVKYREELKNYVSGKITSVQINSKEKITLYVSQNDYALKRYANVLCLHLKKQGMNMQVKEYNDTMLRSRIVSGKFQMFLISEKLLPVSDFKQTDYISLKSKKMRSITE